MKICDILKSLFSFNKGNIEQVPPKGTWILEKGERVLSPGQNSDLTHFLSSQGKLKNWVMLTKNQRIMRRAWRIARDAEAKFGGKSHEYFALSLKESWSKEIK